MDICEGLRKVVLEDIAGKRNTVYKAYIYIYIYIYIFTESK